MDDIKVRDYVDVPEFNSWLRVVNDHYDNYKDIMRRAPRKLGNVVMCKNRKGDHCEYMCNDKNRWVKIGSVPMIGDEYEQYEPYQEGDIITWNKKQYQFRDGAFHEIKKGIIYMYKAEIKSLEEAEEVEGYVYKIGDLFYAFINGAWHRNTKRITSFNQYTGATIFEEVFEKI